MSVSTIVSAAEGGKIETLIQTLDSFEIPEVVFEFMFCALCFILYFIKNFIII